MLAIFQNDNYCANSPIKSAWYVEFSWPRQCVSPILNNVHVYLNQGPSFEVEYILLSTHGLVFILFYFTVLVVNKFMVHLFIYFWCFFWVLWGQLFLMWSTLHTIFGMHRFGVPTKLSIWRQGRICVTRFISTS